MFARRLAQYNRTTRLVTPARRTIMAAARAPVAQAPLSSNAALWAGLAVGAGLATALVMKQKNDVEAAGEPVFGVPG